MYIRKCIQTIIYMDKIMNMKKYLFGDSKSMTKDFENNYLFYRLKKNNLLYG